MEQELNHVIIFDGVCNLCNGFVDFIIRKDKQKIFYFAANQSVAGTKILNKFASEISAEEKNKTIYYLENGKLYTRSTASLYILRKFPLPYRLLFSLIIFPPFLRNFIYNIIAKNRYRWFGKRTTCRIPAPEEAAHFLE